MNTKKYDLIYIDCPWHYYGSGTKNAAAAKHYDLMDQEALKSLDIKSILKRPGMVLAWATGPRLDFAIDVIRSWGLHYRGVAFVWVKTRKDGTIINGQGVPPTFTKPMTEFVLLATTKKSGRAIPIKKFNTPQTILAPRERHSAKPEIFRKHIEETISGPCDKLEIFARRPVVGWDVIGNEINGDDVRDAIAKLNGTYTV